MKAFGLALLALSLSTSAVAAEVIHLHQGQPLLGFSNLKPGVHRYLRYKVQPNGARIGVDIWERRITFAPAPDGKPGMHIVQRWDEVDPKGTFLIQDSWFDRGTFKPLTHIRHSEKDGQVQIRGFRFSDSKVTGLTDLADNSDRDFTMPLTEPSYNFEYDMELLETLPMAAGRTFDIPFYDAGIDKKPDRYRFVVAGAARVTGWDGRPVDCWLVTADYNTGNVVSRFWFTKAGQLLIREEQIQPDGTLLVKTLLPPESADVKPDA